MIRIQQIKIEPGQGKEELKAAIGKAIRARDGEIIRYQILRKSVDARKKDDIKLVYTVDAEVVDESAVLRRVHNPNITAVKKKKYKFPGGYFKPQKRPVIVGSGPAGLFCALMLAEQGACPVILERGEDVERRKRTVEKFWDTGKLDTESNVQFGEGGAGTFSDGKLNTLVKDDSGRNREVLAALVRFGAPKDIMYDSKPHIGTDILSEVVKNIRGRIIDCGGEVRFCTKLTDIVLEGAENRKVKGVVVEIRDPESGETRCETIDTDTVVLAVGHSARDTFKMLDEKKIAMSPKAFAVGVRIEHPQDMINLSQYGEKNKDNKALPTASYKLTKTVFDGRGVYSFCMCPGGYVVNASSEEEMLAVNGMSYRNRDSRNANSAIVVTVTPDDMEKGNVLCGLEFQRRLERAAYAAGGGKVPVQLFGDFKDNRISTELGEVEPCIKGGYAFANLRDVFPEYISEALIEGISAFDNMIKGFGRYDALLAGVESRTSSPVRIMRADNGQSISAQGLYPCGEGAGYAGGITSAAMDGIKTAEAIAAVYCGGKK